MKTALLPCAPLWLCAVAAACAFATAAEHPATPATLAEINRSVEAGDVVSLAAGSYTTPIAPARSGEAGRPIVYRAAPGARPLFAKMDVAIMLPGRSHIAIEGIHVKDVRRFLRADEGSHITIDRCRFEDAPGWESCSLKRMGDFFRFTRNELRNGTDLLSLQGGRHHLIESNSFDTASHTCLVLMGVQRSVVRHNTLRNPRQKLMEVFATRRREYPDPQRISAHNLIENNLFTGTPRAGIQYAGTRNILRRNIFWKCGTGMDFSSYEGSDAPEASFNHDNRFYNNVICECGFGRVGLLFIGVSKEPDWGGQVIMNNIIYRNPCSYDPNRFPGVVPTAQVIYYNSRMERDRFLSNNILFAAPGEKVIGNMSARNYWSLAEYEEAFPERAAGNIAADPLFADAERGDFRLGSGSPCIDAGRTLTVTKAAGEGVTVAVEDVLFFCDGNRVVEPDMIRVGSARARVLRVDYAAGTLALDRPLRWQADAPVSLDYAGRAPDIGAFEFGPASALGAAASPPASQQP